MTCFVLHFLLVGLICSRDLLGVLAGSPSLLPRRLDSFLRRSAGVAAAILGENLRSSNPVRQTVAVYSNAAGIEVGYGFFAPNVPNSYKLVFEFHYPDGTSETSLPEVYGSGAGIRLSNLYDEIAQTQHPPLRELLLRMLSYSAWRQHPAADRVRAVFGVVTLPSLSGAAAGEEVSYVPLYAYDYVLPARSFRPE